MPADRRTPPDPPRPTRSRTTGSAASRARAPQGVHPRSDREPRPAAPRSGQPRPAQSRAGQSRTAQSRTAQSRTAQSRTSQSRTSQSRSAQPRPAQRRPAQGRPSARPGATAAGSTRLGSWLGLPEGGRRPPVRRRRTLRIPLGSSTRRLRIGLLVIAMAVSLCAGRLLQLQGFDSSAYAAASTEQLTRTLALLPARGEITDRNGVVLASTEPAVDITADPTLTSKNAQAIAAIIDRYVDQDPGQTVAALTKPNTRFAYVAKKVPAAVYTQIAQDLSTAGYYGVFRESDPIRTYPAGAVGAGIVGFVGGDNDGVAGFEYARNKQLAGVEGKESYESAPDGSKIPLGTSVVTPAQNGVSYQLSIDSELQWVAEQRLAAQVSKLKADYGFAITMDVRTGQILALANAPSYDASDPGASDPADRGNRAVQETYEPGSVEKILTSAALIDSGTANPDTKVVVPNRVASGGGLIKDVEDHGTVDYRMRGIVAHSSNIGMLLLTRQLPKATLVNYLSSFGLGQPTGIELPAEASGTVPPASMPDYSRDQIAFGQGLSVTGVQEAAAIAGIINGGIYHAPTVVASATSPDGTPADLNRPAPRRVVSAQTSAEVRGLMQAVVYGIKSRSSLSMDHYQTGGKTGTAQRADPKCGCYRGYVTSYVNFAPLNDPSILTYVVINNPRQGNPTGTGNAAPVANDIMQFALPRYGVEPDQKDFADQAAQYTLPLTW
ncbi:cell division protein FtsI (penicillin-binding protein 3) [Friedmanniella endophytica]|uniref:Cell division protein FtsI (Penicillin-binding protein 3) n=1 Tax=Microlunatus kandeliicorticis TaxID=1759536 RepID=A0A7W3ISA0_9ACTN|nr:penicillin-binding protein 2 [Microlunatus kandeliicorticis]MBA8794316.1 cell division protein FtsI (penicillin-binding protein 3) [Microlunatus kandeliicorticis]